MKSCCLISAGEGLDELGSRRAGLADKVPVKLASQERGGLGPIENDADDVGRAPGRGLAEERLHAVIDLGFIEGKCRRFLKPPARA